MTNLEKAKKIANEFIDVAVGAGAFSGALDMANWKGQQYSQDEAYNRGIHDACQQFKEYLEKKRLEYAHKREAHKFNACDEIINELFPATEQDKED